MTVLFGGTAAHMCTAADTKVYTILFMMKYLGWRVFFFGGARDDVDTFRRSPAGCSLLISQIAGGLHGGRTARADGKYRCSLIGHAEGTRNMDETPNFRQIFSKSNKTCHGHPHPMDYGRTLNFKQSFSVGFWSFEKNNPNADTRSELPKYSNRIKKFGISVNPKSKAVLFKSFIANPFSRFTL